MEGIKILYLNFVPFTALVIIIVYLRAIRKLHIWKLDVYVALMISLLFYIYYGYVFSAYMINFSIIFMLYIDINKINTDSNKLLFIMTFPLFLSVFYTAYAIGQALPPSCL